MKYIQPNWAAPVNVRAYATVKNSWGKLPIDTQSIEQLKALLDLPADPLFLKQTHSCIVLPADAENKHKIADASYTNESRKICVVVSADCLPILVCDQRGTYVAAIHAGWRGLSNGVIEAALGALPVPSEDLLVWLGPAIGPQKYEVGVDVYDAFTQKHAASAAGFKALVPGKWLADLYTLAKIRLKLKGVSQIYGGDYCTHTQEDLFYSYRRDKGHLGRIASLIWMD